MSTKNYALLLITILCWPVMANDNSQDTKNKLNTIFQQQFSSNSPGATVLVAKKGQIILHKAYGLANVEHNIPLKVDMHFRIASLTKQFTTTAILKLHQDGKLNIHELLSKHLPNYQHADRVTIAHLASNRSGIPDYTNFEGFKEVEEKREKSLDELIEYFSDQELAFSPNHRQQYSSSNFILLGKLIEHVSGHSYEEYLQNTFFAPLQMDSTQMGAHRKIMPGRVDGYEFEKGKLINAPYLSMTAPHAAGALRSTTMDLYKWQRGLLSGKVINQDLLDKAWSAENLADGFSSTYGFGWFVGHLDGAKTVSHEGGIQGFSTFAAILPEHDVHLIILSNNPHAIQDSLYYLAARVLQVVREKPVDPPYFAVPRKLRAKMVGEYVFEDIWSAKIFEEEGKLFMKLQWEDAPRELIFDGIDAVYYSGTWSKFQTLSPANSRGDIMMQRWDGTRYFGELKKL
ncbi:beta-lactamase family protein [Alteromonas sp. ASW11-19]|uniref:Beta-lactamase family protein n=1 Tax=Alteromonas salexigens TaxID=2982530 RepID=A0ABT2VQJ1_9ALTE|nr:serine hydrolase domain-containing protein [Alteromonas salexigens]MCU7555137.1 beta-lactamase family protein [Alteromonas salexigens]